MYIFPTPKSLLVKEAMDRGARDQKDREKAQRGTALAAFFVFAIFPILWIVLVSWPFVLSGLRHLGLVS